MRALIFSLLASSIPIGCSDASLPSQDAEAQTAKIVAEFKRSPEVDGLIKAALAGTQGYDITESLTTEIGPRVGGSPEEALAREWAVKKFKEIGLQNVRIEPFTMPYWKRGIETAAIISPNPQELYITSLGGSVSTPPGGVEADIA